MGVTPPPPPPPIVCARLGNLCDEGVRSVHDGGVSLCSVPFFFFFFLVCTMVGQIIWCVMTGQIKG